MSHVLGIDVSTTATKAIIVDRAGHVAGIGVAEYGFEIPQPLWSEQDPGLWWAGSQSAIAAGLSAAGLAASLLSPILR